MKNLLHIIASPMGEKSTSLKVSKAVLAVFKEQNPSGKVDSLDLFAEQLPAMTTKPVEGKYRLLSGKELDEETKKVWEPIEAHINRFMAADVVLISVPMWNFGMPYVLKHYIDVIVQPRYLFRYTEKGPEGLAKGKQVVVVSARGGDYSEGPAVGVDHLMVPLKTVLGFIGIPDPTFINIQPALAGGPQVAEQKTKEALAIARKLVF